MQHYSNLRNNEIEAQRSYVAGMSTQLKDTRLAHFICSFNNIMVDKCRGFGAQLPGMALTNCLESWHCQFLLGTRYLTYLTQL